jgi:hypothetical protein
MVIEKNDLDFDILLNSLDIPNNIKIGAYRIYTYELDSDLNKKSIGFLFWKDENLREKQLLIKKTMIKL